VATYLILDQKIKGQSHRVTKCKKTCSIEGDQVAGASLHSIEFLSSNSVYFLTIPTILTYPPLYTFNQELQFVTEGYECVIKVEIIHSSRDSALDEGTTPHLHT